MKFSRHLQFQIFCVLSIAWEIVWFMPPPMPSIPTVAWQYLHGLAIIGLLAQLDITLKPKKGRLYFVRYFWQVLFVGHALVSGAAEYYILTDPTMENTQLVIESVILGIGLILIGLQCYIIDKEYQRCEPELPITRMSVIPPWESNVEQPLPAYSTLPRE